MIKAVIVEDEKPSIVTLNNYLSEYCNNIKVEGNAGKVTDAYNMINKLRPDLVFLDCELPDGTGIDLIKMFNPIFFKTIFITAFPEYAAEAFRFHAVDYLLKPVNIDELISSVKLVEEEIQNRIDNNRMRLLLDHLKQSREYFDQIIIRDQKGFTVVNLADIIQCISYGYCTEFHLKDGHKIVSTRNLGYYQDILEDYGFMRVHHSHMISLKAIKSYSKEQVILMIDNSTVPLGNAYKKKFFNYISKSLG